MSIKPGEQPRVKRTQIFHTARGIFPTKREPCLSLRVARIRRCSGTLLVNVAGSRHARSLARERQPKIPGMFLDRLGVDTEFLPDRSNAHPAINPQFLETGTPQRPILMDVVWLRRRSVPGVCSVAVRAGGTT